MRKVSLIIAALAALALGVSCKKDKNLDAQCDVEAYYTTAIITFKVDHPDGREAIFAEFSVEDPDNYDFIPIRPHRVSSGLFSVDVEHLTPGTRYRLKYGVGLDGYEAKTYKFIDFETKAITMENPEGLYAVAMGVIITREDKTQYEVLWGMRNIGASSAQEYGEYFAWGETATKDDYSWDSYSMAAGYLKVNKYCPKEMPDNWGGSGEPDGLTELEAVDDVATAQRGNGWRIPRLEEWEALLLACETPVWEKVIGNYCIRLKSRTTGKEIFIPAGGRREADAQPTPGNDGAYWSSTLAKSVTGKYVTECGFYLNFTSAGANADRMYARSAGMNIRPCYIKE